MYILFSSIYFKERMTAQSFPFAESSFSLVVHRLPTVLEFMTITLRET